MKPMTVRHVVVTNVITHERFGDLFGSLQHQQTAAVLNNHTLGVTNLVTRYIYEDGEIAAPQNVTIAGLPYSVVRTDGPGHLTDFMGTKGFGLWMLSEVDNALTHTGAVNSVFIRLDPQTSDTNRVIFTIAPHSFAYDFVDVPPEATNLTINVTNYSGSPLPVILYVRRGSLPTQGDYQYFKVINPPGNSLSISTTDLPPLQPGRYYIGIFNPNDISQTVELSWTLGLSLNPVPPIIFSSGGPVPINDDAVSYSSITIPNSQDLQIERINVELSVTHPRLSDVAFTLISPTGKRFVLMENRGGLFTTNADLVFTDNTNFAQIPIKFGGPDLTNTVIMADGFENSPKGINIPAGSVVSGWLVDFGDVDLLGLGDGFQPDTGNQCLDLNGDTTGSISRSFNTTSNSDYFLTFAYSKNANTGDPSFVGTGFVTVAGYLTNQVTYSAFNTVANMNWFHTSTVFRASSPSTKLQFTSTEPGLGGLFLDTIRVAQGYFPEEPMDTLLGDSPQGTWTLEMRDGRAGNPPGTLNAWQLQFNFATNSPGTTSLTDGTTVTNTLFSCGIIPFTVDVPAQATYATNILITASSPVNVWFNQTNPPAQPHFGDTLLINGQTSQSVTLFTNGSPPLIPGARYYLGVENTDCSTNVSFSIRVDFGLDIITLTNMVPYTNNNAGPVLPNDFYHFVIPTNAVGAQFALNNLSGDLDLVVRKGLPLPDLSSFDYLSANFGRAMRSSLSAQAPPRSR